MYKYKRKIDDISNIRKAQFVLSDKKNTSISLNADFSVTKPYNALYIQNGKVIISNVYEEFENRKNKYKICNIVSNQNNNTDDLILSIDLEKFQIEYDNEDFYFSKRLYLEEKTGILAIEYYVKNKSDTISDFRVFPLVTYRPLFDMKNSTMLRFNQRNIKDGAIINLSIANNDDVILNSNDISYRVRTDNSNVNVLTEDLLNPGYFEISIKASSAVTGVIYILTKDEEVTSISTEELSKKDFFLKEKLQNSIENEYVELKELAYSIDKFNINNAFVSCIPYDESKILKYDSIDIKYNRLSEVLDELICITRSIEGEFLTFGKVKEATRKMVELNKYIEYISNIEIIDYNIKYKFCLFKLWYIESINRIVQKQCLFEIFYNLSYKIIYSVLNDNFYEDYMKNIEAISLMYNALKIYEDMEVAKGKECENIIIENEKKLQYKIKDEFWDEEKRAMKENLDDVETCPSVYMLYTISLSYPCIIDDIKFKLLDTVFKELYTPYGLREYSKNSTKNDGLIYPKYMAHFVKANLRQNGVTRASKKIAYNLVKELFLDINKHINVGVKKVYSEKGYQIDSLTYDLLTNSELIRL